MVARFAENLFLAGHRFDLETAIDQLTILWANALGITPDPVATKSKSGRGKGAKINHEVSG
jgi:hypothetical protein